jgi:hypothetical protein
MKNNKKAVVMRISPPFDSKPVYVFTNWGLCRGVITASRIDRDCGIPQYKLSIDVNKDSKGIAYNFWYIKDELHKFYVVALIEELFKPFSQWVKGVFKK